MWEIKNFFCDTVTFLALVYVSFIFKGKTGTNTDFLKKKKTFFVLPTIVLEPMYLLVMWLFHRNNNIRCFIREKFSAYLCCIKQLSQIIKKILWRKSQLVGKTACVLESFITSKWCKLGWTQWKDYFQETIRCNIWFSWINWNILSYRLVTI